MDAADYDALLAQVRAMLLRSPTPGAEEWYVADSEGFGGVKVREDLEEISQAAAFIDQHGELGALAWGEWGSDAQDVLDDRYLGEYPNRDDWAYTELEQLGCPQWVINYVDLEAYGRDLELSHTVLEGKGGVIYVFTEG